MRAIVAMGVLFALGLGSAAAAVSPTFLNPGDRLVLRITRSSQGLDGPVIATSTLLVKRSGDSVVIERTQNGATVDSVLTIDPNGVLQFAASERNAAGNADVRPLLPILDAAIDFAQGATPPGGSLLLSLPLGTQRANGGNGVVVPLRVANLIGNDFDVQGSATTQLQPGGNGAESTEGQPQPNRRRVGIGGPFGGAGGGFGGPGGGFGGPGGGFGGPGSGFDGRSGGTAARGSADAAAGHNAMTVLVRVDGHVAGGRVRSFSLTQTREIEVAGTPFVSADSWKIEVQPQ